jgi:hypothetical protein
VDLRLHYVITSRRPAFHDSFRWIKGFPDPGRITSIISIIRSLRWRPKHGGKKSLVFRRASSGAPLEPFSSLGVWVMFLKVKLLDQHGECVGSGYPNFWPLKTGEKCGLSDQSTVLK